MALSMAHSSAVSGRTARAVLPLLHGPGPVDDALAELALATAAASNLSGVPRPPEYGYFLFPPPHMTSGGLSSQVEQVVGGGGRGAGFEPQHYVGKRELRTIPQEAPHGPLW